MTYMIIRLISRKHIFVRGIYLFNSRSKRKISWKSFIRANLQIRLQNSFLNINFYWDAAPLIIVQIIWIEPLSVASRLCLTERENKDTLICLAPALPDDFLLDEDFHVELYSLDERVEAEEASFDIRSFTRPLAALSIQI